MLAVTPACADRPADDDPANRAALEERHNRFFAALEARDADAVAELFADDGILHVSDMDPVRGREAIRAFYERVFGFMSDTRATLESFHVGRGDVAYSVGETTNEFRGAVTYEGKFLMAWRRVGGEWMIGAYSISSNEGAE